MLWLTNTLYRVISSPLCSQMLPRASNCRVSWLIVSWQRKRPKQGPGFWYPGFKVASALPFLDYQLITLDFQLRIPARYSSSAKSFQYYRILLTNSYLSETMCYVRAGIGFSTLPALLGRKLSSVKSRVSITSKLIENKRLQVLYSGHLRKTGGRGSYQFCSTPTSDWSVHRQVRRITVHGL